MSFDQKDRVIVAQNSSTGAAAIVAAEIASTGGRFDAGRFEEIRSSIFNATLDLALNGSGTTAVARVVDAFPGAQVEQQYAAAAPAEAPRQASSYGAPSAPNADFTINSGKHAGKTLAQIDAEDRSWLTWADAKLQNDYARKRISEYLAATAA